MRASRASRAASGQAALSGLGGPRSEFMRFWPLALVVYALAAINTEARPLINRPLQIRPMGPKFSDPEFSSNARSGGELHCDSIAA